MESNVDFETLYSKWSSRLPLRPPQNSLDQTYSSTKNKYKSRRITYSKPLRAAENKTDRKWGLTSQRKGAPFPGNPIFTSFYPQELAGSQSREEHTTGSSSWGLCRLPGQVGVGDCQKGRDLRGFPRSESKILHVISLQRLGCTKARGKTKNQVESSSVEAKELSKDVGRDAGEPKGEVRGARGGGPRGRAQTAIPLWEGTASTASSMFYMKYLTFSRKWPGMPRNKTKLKTKRKMKNRKTHR